MNSIVFVPARSKSKGLPNKNIKKIRGHSLIEIAIYQAQQINSVKRIIFSSDSDKYNTIAKRAGAEVLGIRPDELSSDESKTSDLILHYADKFKEADCIILLQPTSPVRLISDIESALKIFKTKNKNVTSISLLDEPNPYKLKKLNPNGELESLLNDQYLSSEIPRQLLPKTYRLTGGFYCIDLNKLISSKKIICKGTIGFLTKYYPNIDSQDDLDFLQYLIINNKLPKEFISLLERKHGIK